MLRIDSKQLDIIPKNPSTERMCILRTNIFHVTYSITFDMLPSCRIVAAQVKVIGEQVSSQNKLEVKKNQNQGI